MTLKNFRAIDFKKGENVNIAYSKKDRVNTVPTPIERVPVSKPIIPAGVNEDEVPAGTVAEILSWVGDDKDRASRAKKVESSQEKPRKGLLKSLNEVIKD